MVTFYQRALQNYSKHLLDPNVELEPVFVTYEDKTEFNDINNWTIEKMKQKKQLIKQMLSRDSQNSAMNFPKQMFKTSDYISLYSDVKKQVETERATN